MSETVGDMCHEWNGWDSWWSWETVRQLVIYTRGEMGETVDKLGETVDETGETDDEMERQ